MQAFLSVALTVLGVAGLAPAVQALEPGLADRLVSAYGKLDSYCAHGQVWEPAGDVAGPARELEHCVVRDGRFRSVVTSSRRVEVTWSDGEFHHFHHRITDERPHDYYGRVSVAHMIAPGVPPILDQALEWYGLGVADMAHLRGRFGSFVQNAELSTATLVAWEAPPDGPELGRRIWIGREDGLIRRVGWPTPALGEIVLTEVRLDQVLAPQALRHEAPLSARAMAFAWNYLPALALAISAVSVALGFAYGHMRRRAAGAEGAARARAWRHYRWLLAITAPLAILLGLFAPTGDDMAGAARLIEHLAWALGWLYVLWLAGLFLLGRSLSRSPLPCCHPPAAGNLP
jgi:hypothetical protein